jgi:hypothetical protein
MQLHVELKQVLGDSVSEAFKEGQKYVVMTSYHDNALLANENPLALYREESIQGGYPSLLPRLKSFLLTGDRLTSGTHDHSGIDGMAYHKSQTGAFLRDKHYFWRNHHSPRDAPPAFSQCLAKTIPLFPSFAVIVILEIEVVYALFEVPPEVFNGVKVG